MKNYDMKRLFWLFRTNFFISAFTFGGGYVVLPLIKKYFVRGKNYFSEDELMDMAAIAQSSPGAIAINMAALASYRVCGLPGAIVGCLSATLPPLIILSVISTSYAAFRDNRMISACLKGMEAGVAALIIDVVVDMANSVRKEKQWFLTVLIPVSFLANFVFDINVVWILLSAAAICFFTGRRKEGKKPHVE